MQYDVIIIGAGAAGLMAAIEAGKRGRQVLVLDQANKPGKKILMSGGGRCNFTNLHTSSSNYISKNPHFCKSALSRFTPVDFIELVKKHRIAYHEKTLGQLFCDDSSKDIVNLLLAECRDANVGIQLDTLVKNIEKLECGFSLLANEEKLLCESLVIATGGLSIPSMGSSPFAYQVAEQFGIKLLPTRAGLVPLTLHEADKIKLAELSGISLNVIASCKTAQFKEALLFTHRGLSGPAILQLSSYWQPGEAITVNFLPELDLTQELISQQKGHPNQTLKTCLNQFLPKRCVPILLDTVDSDRILQSFKHEEFKKISEQLQKWEIKPNSTEGYRTAEVTIGGVDTDALSSKTMEVKNVSGLYFIGEAVDVTGWLGGYNFQWAWASGWVCGQVC